MERHGEKKVYMQPIKIIIHCSATPKGVDYSAADIDRWHRQRGFRKIGYHYVIKLDGTIEKGRLEDEMGAHTLGQNMNSIGICYIGGLSEDKEIAEDTRTEEQKTAIKGLIKSLKRKYEEKGIILTVHGHNEFANKACPCYDVKKEWT